MYGYHMPPPPFWGYPQPNMLPPPDSIEARAYKIAAKLRDKDHKKEEKKKEAEAKKKADDKKKAEDSRRRNLFGLEWYILGILSYPLVGPAYRIITHNLEVFSGAVK